MHLFCPGTVSFHILFSWTLSALIASSRLSMKALAVGGVSLSCPLLLNTPFQIVRWNQVAEILPRLLLDHASSGINMVHYHRKRQIGCIFSSCLLFKTIFCLNIQNRSKQIACAIRIIYTPSIPAFQSP